MPMPRHVRNRRSRQSALASSLPRDPPAFHFAKGAVNRKSRHTYRCIVHATSGAEHGASFRTNRPPDKQRSCMTPIDLATRTVLGVDGS